MWETFISWYINNYVGKYVENLNSQQLSFALRQGELELENVPLKKNIFRSCGLPIEVRSGIVGRIKIEFNILKYLRDEPVLISMENVYLVGAPLNLDEWDPAEEAIIAHEAKMSALDSQEGRWKAHFDLAGNSSADYSSLYFSSLQIGASIVTKVVENLQLNVRNVHVRLEHTIGARTLAFGVVMNSLTAQSCDSTWNPLKTSATGSSTDYSFKTLQLSELAFYCVTNANKFSDLSPLELISGMTSVFKAQDYLLCPITANVRISKNNSSDPLSSTSKPRFEVQFSLEKVPLHMSDSQFRCIYRFYKSFYRLYRNSRLRHYRPFTGSPKDFPKIWWKYAVQAVLAYRGYKQRKIITQIDEMLQRARDIVAFVQAYEQHLNQELLSVELRKLKDRMETELHFEEIIALREIAMRRVERSSEGFSGEKTRRFSNDSLHNESTVSASSSGIFSWVFPSWSNWLYSADSSKLESTSTVSSSVEEITSEIIELRKSESELDDSILDEMKFYGMDSLLARFKFSLKKGLVTLTKWNTRFLEMNFTNVDISTEIRPRSGAHKFQMSLETLSLRDCLTGSLLVSHQNAEDGGVILSEPIFKIGYERKPHKKAGHRIILITKPLNLVIHPYLWKQVTCFFACEDIEDYLDIHQNRYDVMKERTKEELRIYWKTLINSRMSSDNRGIESSWEIKLDIAAPQIIIYDSELSPNWNRTRAEASRRIKLYETSKTNQKFVVFDFGRFRFSNLNDPEQSWYHRDFVPHVGGSGTESESMEDDEKFVTPSSSPDPPQLGSNGDSINISSSHSNVDLCKHGGNEPPESVFDLSNVLGELQAKFYKKYKLEITDVQVVVYEGKSGELRNWREVNSKNSSPFHLVDRFSIDIQFERRLVSSEDPKWPALTVMATLPNLDIHLNHSKIHSLQNVISSYLRFIGEDASWRIERDRLSVSDLSCSQLSLTELSDAPSSTGHELSPSSVSNKKKLSVPTKLEFVVELDLLNVSIEVLKERDHKLCQVQFLQSKFTLQNFSDGSRDLDLTSQEILVADTRCTSIRKKRNSNVSDKRCNIFTNILQETTKIGAKNINHSKQSDKEVPLHSFKSATIFRAEIHHRHSTRGSKLTIILSNVRLMLILDWWMEIITFYKEHFPSGQTINSGNESEIIEIPNHLSLLVRSNEFINPVTVSTGIVTKRAPVLDIPDKIFDLRLNVNHCELVVVEDPSQWDTHAVILKITALLIYRPHIERPLFCSITESELFSCILGIESETALSILDPADVNVEIIRISKQQPQGIMDATPSTSPAERIIQVKTGHLSLRLSYYDMRMFLHLLERFTEEVQNQMVIHSPRNQPASPIDFSLFDREDLGLGLDDELYLEDEAYRKLAAMGFPLDLCFEALERCDGKVEEAALLLTSSPKEYVWKSTGNAQEGKQAAPNSLIFSNTPSETVEQNCSISRLEFRCSTFSICVIDDCKDADVPLAEFSMSGLELVHNYLERYTIVQAILSGEYYNRELSGWEPLLEPWKFELSFTRNELGMLRSPSPSREFPLKAPEIEMSLSSNEIMNINITSTLINLLKTVAANWSDVYAIQDKRRAPFVPYAVRNETGSSLSFCTVICNQGGGGFRKDRTAWIEVPNDAMQTFSFEGRGKLRHRITHQLRTHQIAVRVNGWHESSLVTVDRVGTYFRDVTPISNVPKLGVEMAHLPKTRLVFEVTLQGSAQKLIRIRSALLVRNTLPEVLELQLENTIIYPAFEMVQSGGSSYCLYISPGQVCPIPLHSVSAQMWVRPILPSESQRTVYSYCSKPLLLPRDSEGLRTCTSLVTNQSQPYRFCVGIRKDEFPEDISQPLPQENTLLYNVTVGLTKRANCITIFSPLIILNLLSHEVFFEIKEQSGITQVGRIRAGKKTSLTNVDTMDYVEIVFTTENFLTGSSIRVSMSTSPFVWRLKLLDSQRRVLYLNAKISRGDGGVIVVKIICPYWIVNKSGLPIMIKQEGANQESAGQFQENEQARMMLPVLFNFPDPETVDSNVTLRVGTGLHPSAKPYWCQSFRLDNGILVRKLTVSLSSSQPELVYVIGVEVKNGKGKYRDTKFVIITPRFVIENRSSRGMQISQRNFATCFLDPAAEKTHLTVPPGCTIPFHWPRLDKDQLLCVRLTDINGRGWSGGFSIENVLSFHLNVRDDDGRCNFLRVESVLEGPTYFVVFSDTDQLPPPFRVDNLSLAPIIFHQTNIGDERLKLVAKAESSCSYAWDEPTQPSNITLSAPGGTSVIANLNSTILGFIAHITYENFFYIGLTATFPQEDENGLAVSGMESLQLVFDVPNGTKVVLSKKEIGNRNQLWRVNADGLIEHEGSSPPRDPRKPAVSSSLVLDTAGQASIPTQCVHLMLRKPNKRRACTQHWEFTSDGRLKCSQLTNMFVQAKDGFKVLEGKSPTSVPSLDVAAWKMWNDVVLGPPQPVCHVRMDSGIPAEQAIGKQKLRPGSGRLAVSIDTDGPTRIIRITDTEKPPRGLLLKHTLEENPINTIPRISLSVELLAGLGLSLINCNPREELAYVYMSKVSIQWTDTKESETVSAFVDYLQIDNQLLESEKSVAVFVTPTGRSDLEDKVAHPSALCVNWKRLKSKLNAHLFKEFELSIKPLNIILEEKLLLKLLGWFGLGKSSTCCNEDTEVHEAQKPLTNSVSLTTKRYYFGQLRIILNTVRLSVLTSSKLATELSKIKRRLGLTLIRFEETLVELDSFYKQHPFETLSFLIACILKHYKDELLSQALVVLGSVDFLGNPVGFVNDVSVGVSSLIQEGSLNGLVLNVAHGISNSAAKVAGSLGDGLTRALTLDDEHEEQRRRIREEMGGSFSAGIQGFQFGLMGGLTSVACQSYDGAINSGFLGFVAGLGKGLVGTVTKPAVGVLDLAAGMASAVRDSARPSARKLPKRIRGTRVVVGNGGLLPAFSNRAAKGQEIMYEISGRNSNAVFIGCETVHLGTPRVRILVSSERIIVFTLPKPSGKILEIALRDLLSCRVAEVGTRNPSLSISATLFDKKFVIEFTLRNNDVNKPQVTVDNTEVAKTVVQEVNYAQILYEEMRHSQINKPNYLTEE